MEDFDNAKTKDLNECVVTDLNGYLTYISDIKETIKKEEGQQRMGRHAGSVPWWDAATRSRIDKRCLHTES